MNTITVSVSVQQQESIRRGRAADSTSKIPIDLDTLDNAERTWLGDNYRDGRVSICVPQPDADGLREAIREKISERIAAEARETKELAELSRRVEAGEDPYISGSRFDRLTPAAQNILTRRYADREAAQTAERARKDAEAAAWKAAVEEAKARLAQQRADFLACPAHVDSWLAQRYAAGLATDTEIDQAIRNVQRESRGVTYTGGPADWHRDDGDRVDTCTDEQFAIMRAWANKLPVGIGIKLYDLHNHPENEDGEKNDEQKVDRILVAEASWKIGEITVSADAQIGTLPDETDED